MFQDMALSQDLTAAFRSDSASASAEDLADVDVMVLTAGSWPVSQSTSLLTCPEVWADGASRRDRAPSRLVSVAERDGTATGQGGGSGPLHPFSSPVPCPRSSSFTTNGIKDAS